MAVGSIPNSVPQPLRGFALALLTVSLSLGTFMMVLDYSIANVSIPYIAGSLGVSDTDGTWVITCFAAGNAIGLPLTGFVTAKFGNVKTFVVSTILFTILSWLCGAAFNFPMLLVSRFFQGFFSGPLIPLSQSLLMVFYPPAKRKLALAIWGAVVIIGPIIGPILGGFLTYNYVWRWIFYINIPFGILAAWITWKIAKTRDTTPVRRKIDFVGLSLLAIGVTCLQVMVDNGEQFDWFRSNMIIGLTIASLIGFVVLVIWQLTSDDPLIDLKLFKNRNFALGTAVTAIAYTLFFGNMVVMPLWLQEFMGYTAEWAGFVLAWMGLLPLVLMPLVVKLMEKCSLRFIVGICMTLFFVVFISFSFFTPQVGYEFLSFSRLCLGAPIALYMAPLTALTLSRVPAEKLTMASGIFHFVRIFFGGIGTSLLTTLWERRTTFHHFNLATDQTVYNPMTAGMMHMLNELNLTGKKALTMFNLLVDQQAAVLALNDVFWVTAWCFVPLIGLTFFFQRRPQHGIAADPTALLGH